MKIKEISQLQSGQKLILESNEIVTVDSQDNTELAMPMAFDQKSKPMTSKGRVRLKFDDETIGILNWEDARAVEFFST